MFERKGARRLAEAFTLVELLVIIGAVAVLGTVLVLLLPTGHPRSPRDVVCKSNLRNVIFNGLQMYAADNGGWIPAVGRMGPENNYAAYDALLRGWAVWVDRQDQAGIPLGKLMDTNVYAPKDDNAFRCPTLPHERPSWGPDYWLNDFMASANDDSDSSYGGNFKDKPDGSDQYWQYRISKTHRPGEMYLAGEDNWQKATYQNTDAVFRYGLWIGDSPGYPKTKVPSFPHPTKKTNVLFQDGHVPGMTLQQMRQAYAPDATPPSPRPLPWFNGEKFDDAAGFGGLKSGWNEADLLK